MREKSHNPLDDFDDPASMEGSYRPSIAQGVGQECPHNALQKCKEQAYTFTAYTCGRCSCIFEVSRYREPEPIDPKPMFDSRPLWGNRNRQA